MQSFALYYFYYVCLFTVGYLLNYAVCDTVNQTRSDRDSGVLAIRLISCPY